MKKIRLIMISGILFLVVAVTTGCEQEKEVQKAVPVAPAVVVKKEEVEEIKKEDELIEFIYTSEGKRNPFKPFIRKVEVKKEEKVIPLTPLQRFAITQLKLTGVITAEDSMKSRAMVEDPTGKGYILKVGTLIGKNFGRVSNIMKNSVIVTEEIQDFLGNIITKEIPLTLEIEEGE